MDGYYLTRPEAMTALSLAASMHTSSSGDMHFAIAMLNSLFAPVAIEAFAPFVFASIPLGPDAEEVTVTPDPNAQGEYTDLVYVTP